MNYLSVIEAAKFLKLHHVTIRRMIKSKKIPCYKIGSKRLLIKGDDLLALIEKGRCE